MLGKNQYIDKYPLVDWSSFTDRAISTIIFFMRNDFDLGRLLNQTVFFNASFDI